MIIHVYIKINLKFNFTLFYHIILNFRTMDEESIFMFMLLQSCNYEYIRAIEGRR